MWVGIIYPKDCPMAYVGFGANIVWTLENARRFTTSREALDAATDLSFEGEGIDSKYIEEGSSTISTGIAHSGG